jgi:hypothetical protein
LQVPEPGGSGFQHGAPAALSTDWSVAACLARVAGIGWPLMAISVNVSTKTLSKDADWLPSPTGSWPEIVAGEATVALMASASLPTPGARPDGRVPAGGNQASALSIVAAVCGWVR